MHKKMNHIISLALTLTTTSFLLSACGGGSGSSANVAPVSTTIPVSINFDLLANGTSARCGTSITGLGTKNTTVDLKDARFYVNNVNLVDANGQNVPVTLTPNDWQSDQVALINLIDGNGAVCGGVPLLTNTVITGTVPSGTYTGIQYEIGVPEALNHSDYATAPKPLGVAGMAWSWTSGRKFLKLEVNPVGGVNVIRTNTATTPATTTTSNGSTWYTHLGATGCSTNATTGAYSCTNSNRMLVKLSAFDASKQKISLDLNAFYAGADLTTDLAGATGCMSGSTDTECAAIFNNMKIDLNSGKTTSNGAQSIFVARAK